MAEKHDLMCDLECLEALFCKRHKLFRVTSILTDELKCIFIIPDGKILHIRAHFAENYPSSPPIWNAENEDVNMTAVFQKLANTTGLANLILPQIHLLIKELCDLTGAQKPRELGALKPIVPEAPFEYNFGDESEISTEHKDILQKITARFSEICKKGSVQATDRLLKDLNSTFRCESYKKGIFTVELKKEDLYEWVVKLYMLDTDSALQKDLMLLKEKEGTDHILCNIKFKKSHPFEPPFLHIIRPVLTGDFLIGGGAICMGLLRKKVWSASFNVEMIIRELADTLVKGYSRIVFEGNTEIYSFENAQSSFNNMELQYTERGWKYTVEFEDEPNI